MDLQHQLFKRLTNRHQQPIFSEVALIAAKNN